MFKLSIRMFYLELLSCGILIFLKKWYKNCIKFSKKLCKIFFKIDWNSSKNCLLEISLKISDIILKIE